MSGLSADDVEFLNDILGLDGSDSDGEKDPSRKSEGSQKPRSSGPKVKCVQVCIGGTSMPVGATTDVNKPRSCSELFCIHCDHPVVRFTDCKWTPNTDYLFLRNNYPDTVRSNLLTSRGSCAYCCQCTFCTEDDAKKLAPYDTSWVCRGH